MPENILEVISFIDEKSYSDACQTALDEFGDNDDDENADYITEVYAEIFVERFNEFLVSKGLKYSDLSSEVVSKLQSLDIDLNLIKK